MTKAKATPKTEAVVRKPDGTITFSLTISQNDVATTYTHVLTEVASTMELKGFRKGKAPIAMVEQSVDKSRLYSHVLEHVLPPAYAKVMTDKGLRPLVEPRVTPKSMEDGKDWEFAVETAGKPEIALGEYEKYLKDVKVEKTKEPEKAQDAKLTAIFDALLQHAKLEISPLLVDTEARAALSKLVGQLNSLHLTVEDYAKSIKKTQDELVKDYQETAVTNLKLEFLLQAIADEKKLARKATLDYLLAL